MPATKIRKPEGAASYYGTYQRLALRYGLASTPRQVIAAARRKIAPKHRNAAAKRADRKRFYRIMLYWHHMHAIGKVF